MKDVYNQNYKTPLKKSEMTQQREKHFMLMDRMNQCNKPAHVPPVTKIKVGRKKFKTIYVDVILYMHFYYMNVTVYARSGRQGVKLVGVVHGERAREREKEGGRERER